MSLNSFFSWWTNNERLIALLFDALQQTLAMVFTSGLIGFVFGIPLGVLLHLSKKSGT
jgi:D-methionine transport system permease protein